MTKLTNWRKDSKHANAGEEAARISVRQGAAGEFTILAGRLKLIADIEVWGRTQVEDIDTGKIYFVHDIDGILHCISEDVQKAMDAIAESAINRAKLKAK